MKKLAFLMVLVVILVGMMTSAAFAVRYDSTYSAFAGSPHGQYSTATTKCSACHAVHNPGGLETATAAQRADQAYRAANLGGSQVLLRSSVANACLYCHVSGNFAIKTVYAETAANYNGGNVTNAHNTNGGAMSDTGVNCTDCHQVHGAATMMASYNVGTSSVDDGYLYKKILKDQPAYDTDTVAWAANGAGAVNGANMSKWCSGCHVYYSTAHNSDTHIMGAANVNYSNGAATNFTGQAAFTKSTFCRDCHANGVVDQLAAANGANNFPHFVSGYRFLNQGNNNAASAAATSANDGARPTRHATPAAGAGATY